jgi:TolB-like protein/class 3 adenylate cyclase/Tfp pilus assembly protein PilF
MSPSRRTVATVLFTDIVGSTETAQRLGDRRWRDVLARHHAFVRSQLHKYQGEEIATAGDGFLAVFESPALALLCAGTIRDGVREFGLEIRAGIHHGEIQREGGTVGGIALHIGARVAALAEGGETLVSGTVRDAVQGAGFEFTDRGEKSLKGVSGTWHLLLLSAMPEGLEEELLDSGGRGPHIRRPVVAALAIAGVVVMSGLVALRAIRNGDLPDRSFDTRGPPTALSETTQRSIAVLPFEVRSSHEDDRYFASGMHDDLLARLSKIDSIKVISRTSVEGYADRTIPIPQIADDLDVTTVLEGAIQRSGDRIRLTVQLIDAREDEHLWAATYDEELTADNLFAIQSNLAERIAGSLRARLRSDNESRWGARPTESLDAYLHWARGVHLAYNTSRSTQEAAAEEFRKAIQADSTYALPWAELAWTELSSWFNGYRPAPEAFPVVRSAIDQALALEPGLALAHVVSGRLLMSQWRFEEAENELLRAIDLAPSSSVTHGSYGALLFLLERFEESEEEERRAFELDPLNPDRFQRIGWTLWAQRDWEGAIRQARRTLEVDPNNGEAYNLLGNALGRKGDHAAAYEAIEEGRARDPDWGLDYWTVALANAYARAGDRAEALRLLDRLPPDAGGYLLLWVAAVHGTLGDKKEAFSILEGLIQEDPYILAYIGFDRDMDPIRDDPRFEEVQRRAREEVMLRNASY